MIEVNDKLKVFFSNRVVYPISILTVLLNISMFFMLYKYVDFSRDSHVLHYNFYFGIDLLGGAINLIYVPIIGFLLFVVNFIWAFWVYKNKESFFLSYFVLVATLFANIELFMYLLGIISIEY